MHARLQQTVTGTSMVQRPPEPQQAGTKPAMPCIGNAPVDSAMCSSIYLQGSADTAKLVNRARLTQMAPDAIMYKSEWTKWADCSCQKVCRQSQLKTCAYTIALGKGSPDMQAPARARANVSLPQAAWQGSNPTCNSLQSLSY